MENQQKEEERFSDKLDVYQFVSEVKLSLRKNITSDFVLAKLGQKDKEGIIEMTGNAYLAKRLIDRLAKGCKDKEKKKKIEEISKATFDMYMNRIYMTVILNRNVDKNYLINVLSGYDEKEEEIEDAEEDKEEMKSKIKQLLRNQEKEEK